MRVTIGQINTTNGDIAGNVARIVKAIEQARRDASDLIVFPEITIQGYTYSQDGVARLLERLAVIPDLQNVQLQTSVSQLVGTHTVISFTIVSDIRTGRGAS